MHMLPKGVPPPLPAPWSIDAKVEGWNAMALHMLMTSVSTSGARFTTHIACVSGEPLTQRNGSLNSSLGKTVHSQQCKHEPNINPLDMLPSRSYCLPHLNKIVTLSGRTTSLPQDWALLLNIYEGHNWLLHKPNVGPFSCHEVGHLHGIALQAASFGLVHSSAPATWRCVAVGSSWCATMKWGNISTPYVRCSPLASASKHPCSSSNAHPNTS